MVGLQPGSGEPRLIKKSLDCRQTGNILLCVAFIFAGFVVWYTLEEIKKQYKV